jgi:RNase P subunit RPR2
MAAETCYHPTEKLNIRSEVRTEWRVVLVVECTYCGDHWAYVMTPLRMEVSSGAV